MEKEQLQKLIKYYQTYKEQFWFDCLQADPNERQYLYNDWIEDYFISAYPGLFELVSGINGLTKTKTNGKNK